MPQRNEIFRTVKMLSPSRNAFNLSHDHAYSGNFGWLYPTMCIPMVPGDTFKFRHQSIVRFAPLVNPVMHRYNVFHHTFFIPWRILWKNFENYMTMTKTDADLDPVFPYALIGDGADCPVIVGSLSDYLGIPPTTSGFNVKVSIMRHLAYQKTWSEFFRDQNLQPKWDYDVLDGDNSINWAEYQDLRRRAWNHDYFTSALPTPQKGPAVELPLGNFDNVQIKRQPDGVFPNTGTANWNVSGVNVGAAAHADTDPSVPGIDPGYLYMPGDELTAEAITMNELRTAEKLQEFYERLMRGGSRFNEVVRSMFNVDTGDSRLQRPEYITGSKTPVMISEVLQTSETAATPQANMAGHGVSVAGGQGGRYFAREWGYLMTFTSVLPETGYYQGIPKDLLKVNDLYEQFWTPFQHLGEQAILNDEIYAYQATGAATFGYTPRYAEYRFENNRVSGQFRTTLETWQHARKFAALPNLNGNFIECRPDYRPFAVTESTEDHLWIHQINDVYALRPMSKYGVPMWS